MDWLKGKKTYLVVIVGVIVNGLAAMDIIPAAFIPTVNTVLGLLGLATIRAGISGK